MGLPPSDDELMEIFMPHAMGKLRDVEKRKKRFVHYTSAVVAKSILENENVWMRQSRCMNDFMEVEYGVECLRNALTTEAGAEFRKILNEQFDGSGERVIHLLDSYLPSMLSNSYLTCISEHNDWEDEHGRLSMWRAYGGSHSVAFVLNNRAFLSRSTALNAFTSPVGYFSEEQFRAQFDGIVSTIETNVDKLLLADPKIVENMAYNACMFAIFCTKHPGFAEELEWRVIHCPDMHPSSRLSHSIETINGVPQPIYKIPLIEIPDEGFEGASLPNLLNRVIIGPSEYPDALRQAFVSLLERKGIESAAEKVVNSGIPLR